jgi:hypothetical protein
MAPTSVYRRFRLDWRNVIPLDYVVPCCLIALIAAGGLMAVDFGSPEADIQAPEALALVHLVTRDG